MTLAEALEELMSAEEELIAAVLQEKNAFNRVQEARTRLDFINRGINV